MKPIDFPASNVVIAKDQEQYLSLPAHRDEESEACPVVSCWQLTFGERIRILLTGRMWVSTLTFKHSVQPTSLGVTVPIYRWGAKTSEPETMIVKDLAEEKRRRWLNG